MDLLSLRFSPGAVAEKTGAIYEAALKDSREMRGGNFTVIGVDDLAGLFQLYDEHFFSGWLAQAVQAQADGPLTFRASRTMTSAGGKTLRSRFRGGDGVWKTRYQIAVASRLLFMTFDDVK